MIEAAKERAKLTANFFNGIAVSSFAGGAIAPIVALTSGGELNTFRLLISFLITIVLVPLSLFIHRCALNVFDENYTALLDLEKKRKAAGLD